MDTSDLVPLIELLDDNIDDLEESLSSLLKRALSDTAGKLPLLDKAQLYVLVTYAIESILFSYLRLNGVNAKEHSVFRELTRVKQYFEKIKTVESGDTSKKSMTVDKAVAGRFIKYALAANKSGPSGTNQTGQNQVTKGGIHIKFEQGSKKRKIEDDQGATSLVQASQSSSSGSQQLTPGAAAPESVAQPVVQEKHTQLSKRKRKRSKQQRSEAKREASGKED